MSSRITSLYTDLPTGWKRAILVGNIAAIILLLLTSVEYYNPANLIAAGIAASLGYWVVVYAGLWIREGFQQH